MKEAKELLPIERKKLAQEDFNYWFSKSGKLISGFQFYFQSKDYNEAAFLLHQATERLYSGILLVFTRYKPNTHGLAILRKLANSVDTRLIPIFSLDSPESRRLFKLLRKAYVDARYKPSYTITQDELSILANQVEQLHDIGQLICTEMIDQLAL